MIQGTMLLLLCPEVARKKCLGMSLITVDFKRAYSLLVEGMAGERHGYCLLLIHSGQGKTKTKCKDVFWKGLLDIEILFYEYFTRATDSLIK